MEPVAADSALSPVHSDHCSDNEHRSFTFEGDYLDCDHQCETIEDSTSSASRTRRLV